MSETNSVAHQTLAVRRTSTETAADQAAPEQEKSTADTRTAQDPETPGVAAPPRPLQTPCSTDSCSKSRRLCASIAKHHKAANAAPPAPEEHAPNRSLRKRHPRNPEETNSRCPAEEILA